MICDFGSQYTLLIAKTLREIGVYAEIIPGDQASPPSDFSFHAIILSGGPGSVAHEGSPSLPSWVLESEKPVLGICYGMQLLLDNFGGRVRSGQKREFGKSNASINTSSKSQHLLLFKDIPKSHQVWMSHGDDLEKMPEIFSGIATTGEGVVAAIAHNSRPIFGLQYHPEVQHTEYGNKVLQNFVEEVCKAPRDWQTGYILQQIQASIRAEVKDGRVLLAVSGGVDSSVAALLLTRALGPEHVHAVLVDHGMMRKHEVKTVEQQLQGLGLNLRVLSCAELFFKNLKGVKDPEEKRKIIGKTFIECFEAFALAAEQKFTHLGQGTLYPDVIESAAHGTGAKVIKSHHNVGGLPEQLNLKLVEPFRFLFKDEVRAIGRELGLPSEMILRHPFPGPGLGVRIPGEVFPEKVKILQEADDIFCRALKREGLYEQIWQAATILLPVKSVGVMGDNRTYQWSCVLRAVTGVDAMTAEAAEIPLKFLTELATEIVQNVPGINRVLYDVTSKPPATIEWE